MFAKRALNQFISFTVSLCDKLLCVNSIKFLKHGWIKLDTKCLLKELSIKSSTSLCDKLLCVNSIKCRRQQSEDGQGPLGIHQTQQCASLLNISPCNTGLEKNWKLQECNIHIREGQWTVGKGEGDRSASCSATLPEEQSSPPHCGLICKSQICNLQTGTHHTDAGQNVLRTSLSDSLRIGCH